MIQHTVTKRHDDHVVSYCAVKKTVVNSFSYNESTHADFQLEAFHGFLIAFKLFGSRDEVSHSEFYLTASHS